MNFQERNEQDYITKLFQELRTEEAAQTPAFEVIFGEAKQKQNTMKIRRWLAVAAMIAVIAFVGIAHNNTNPSGENIITLKATTPLYTHLMKYGKIVTNDIYFEYDKAVLQAKSTEIIVEMADMLKAHPEIRLSIEGHTDSQGSTSYNQKLSNSRAAAVKQALLQLGIADERLTYKGWGESKPAYSNDNENGKKRNRRVEFVLLK